MCTPRRDAIVSAPAENGIERIEATFTGNGFSPHRHDTYALGLTISGIQTFCYRGASRFSLPGRLIILHPDELHDGGAGDEAGLTYRMIYISPEKINAALNGHGNGQSLPFVRTPVVEDNRLQISLMDALSDLDCEMGELKRDCAIAEIATHLARLGDCHRKSAVEVLDGNGLARCRDFIDASKGDNIGSKTLEEITGLDRFTLARQFRTRFGTSPHRYLVQRRLDHVRRLITTGETLAAAAIAAGFADQSHMTRHFRNTYGMTPGRWQTLQRTG